VRTDFLESETFRDFPGLCQKPATYIRVRTDQGPDLLDSEFDRQALVYLETGASTWESRYSGLLLLEDVYRDLLVQNPLGLSPKLWQVGAQSLSALVHFYPRPLGFLPRLTLYLQALRDLLGGLPAPILSSPLLDPGLLSGLLRRYRAQLALALHPTRMRRSPPLQSYWVRKGYSPLAARLLASMCSDVRALECGLGPVAKLPEDLPADPEMDAAAHQVVARLFRWAGLQISPIEGANLPEYLPTFLLPLALQGHRPGAFIELHKTGVLDRLRFSPMGRLPRGNTRTGAVHPVVCDTGLTEKVRDTAPYLGYRWTARYQGVRSYRALWAHASYVNTTISMYGMEKVRPWYRYLYVTRGLLLREDSKLDTQCHLLRFFLEHVGDLDRELVVLPARVIHRRKGPLRSTVEAFLTKLKGSRAEFLVPRFFAKLQDEWTLPERLRVVKGVLEGVYGPTRFRELWTAARELPPFEVLPRTIKTLHQVQEPNLEESSLE